MVLNRVLYFQILTYLMLLPFGAAQRAIGDSRASSKGGAYEDFYWQVREQAGKGRLNPKRVQRIGQKTLLPAELKDKKSQIKEAQKRKKAQQRLEKKNQRKGAPSASNGKKGKRKSLDQQGSGKNEAKNRGAITELKTVPSMLRFGDSSSESRKKPKKKQRFKVRSVK